MEARLRSGKRWLARVLDSRRTRGIAIPYGAYANDAGTLGFTALLLPGHDPPDDPGDEVDRAPPDDYAVQAD